MGKYILTYTDTITNKGEIEEIGSKEMLLERLFHLTDFSKGARYSNIFWHYSKRD